MFRFFFRIIFRFAFLLVFVSTVFVGYHLYNAGFFPGLQRQITDTTISISAKAALIVHRDFSDRPITANTEHGVVTLSGSVRTKEEREKAFELILQVKGVTSVHNQLPVDPTLSVQSTESLPEQLQQQLEDVALRTKILAALHLDKETRDANIEITSSSGHVVIRGKVNSDLLAKQIRSRISSFSEVKSLDDKLEISSSGS